MKQLIALILITLAASAQAQHQHNYHNHNRGGNWMAPAIIGGLVGYAITRNYYEPVYNYGYVMQPPVIVQQSVLSVCTPWTETQHADGTITRTRTCQ